MELPSALLSPSSENKKKTALKKFVMFSQKKLFLYFRKRNFLIFSKNLYFLYFFLIFSIFFLYFRRLNFPALRIKNFRKELLSSKSKKTHSEKLSYISGSETLKPKIKTSLIFQEGTLKSPAKKNSYFLRVSKNNFINFRHNILLQAKKKTLVSGNWPCEKVFITHLPAWSNMYQNIYFLIKNNNKKQKKDNNNKKEKKQEDKKKQYVLLTYLIES